MRRIAGAGVKSPVTGITFAVPLMEPFMEEVLPESREGKYYDYSDLKEINEAAEEYLMAV